MKLYHHSFQFVIPQHRLVFVWQVWDKSAQPCRSLQFNKGQRSSRGVNTSPVPQWALFSSLLTTVLNHYTHTHQWLKKKSKSCLSSFVNCKKIYVFFKVDWIVLEENTVSKSTCASARGDNNWERCFGGNDLSKYAEQNLASNTIHLY